MENLPNGSANTAKHNEEDEESKHTINPVKVPDFFIYREDVVSLKSKEDARGLVLEVAGEYDSEGSVTNDDDNDGATDTEEHEHKNVSEAENGGTDGDNASNGSEVDSQSSLPDNKVRVLCVDGSEKTEDIDDVVVVDRSFLHGDLVASASDPTDGACCGCKSCGRFASLLPTVALHLH